MKFGLIATVLILCRAASGEKKYAWSRTMVERHSVLISE